MKPESSLEQPQTPTPLVEPVKESTMHTVVTVLRPAIVITLLLTLIVGVMYPLLTTGVGQLFFPSQANGSLVTKNGQTIASSLIGQQWTAPQYFHGRPSATNNLSGTPAPYEADNSGASNLGPTNAAQIQNVQDRVTAIKKENPDVPSTTQVPIDLVTASGSGLDPDISVAGAYYQVARIAKARRMTEDTVKHIIDNHIQGRFLGVFGEPHLNVLELNQALDAAQEK